MLPSFEFFDYLLPPTTFDVLSLFRNIHVLQMSIIVNFDIDRHFQGHLLHTLDAQAWCEYFGENSMTIGWIVSEYFNVFSAFPGDTFSTWKWSLSCATNSNHADTFYWTRVPRSKSSSNSRTGWIVFEKSDPMCFPFHLKNMENEAIFWGEKIKLYCPPHTELRISWNFLSAYSRFARFVGPTVQKRRKRKVWSRKP